MPSYASPTQSSAKKAALKKKSSANSRSKSPARAARSKSPPRTPTRTARSKSPPRSANSNTDPTNGGGKMSHRKDRPPPSASLKADEASGAHSMSLNSNNNNKSNTEGLSSTSSKPEHGKLEQPPPKAPQEDPLLLPSSGTNNRNASRGHTRSHTYGVGQSRNKNNNSHMRTSSTIQVDMSEGQLRAALDRFGLEMEPEDGKPPRIAESQSNSLTLPFSPYHPYIRNEQESSDETDVQQRERQKKTKTGCGIVAGAVACLCSATLGAGILSLPFAMAEAGIVCGMAMLLGSAVATALSIQLLAQAMHVVYYSSSSSQTSTRYQQLVNSDANTEKTYEDLVEICLGKVARRVAEASMLIFCCGAAIAYVIAVGDIIQQSGWSIVSQSNHSKGVRALSMTIVWTIAMVPLSMLRTMKSLQCASSIGVASIATLVIAALYHYLESPHNNDQPTPVPTTLWDDVAEDSKQSILLPTRGILSILRACPIILFAFSCQVNVCAIYDEMPQKEPLQSTEGSAEQADPDQATGNEDLLVSLEQQQQQLSLAGSLSKHRRMIIVTWVAVGICAFLYTSISIIALLDFGSTNMTPNILSSYNAESIMQVAFVGMAIAVVLAYPMNIFPARVTLLGIYRSRQQQETSTSSHVPNASSEGDLNENTLTDPLLSASESTAAAGAAVTTTAMDNPGFSSDSLMEHIVATFFLTGLSLGLALVAPNISVVFGLLGGTSSSVLGFVIPGLLGYKTAEDFYWCTATSHDDVNESAIVRTKALSSLLVAAGILVGVITTGVTVYSTFAVPT